METSSNQRMRCNFSLESQLPSGGSVWNIVQVSQMLIPPSSLDACPGAILTLPLRIDRNDSATNGSNLATVRSPLLIFGVVMSDLRSSRPKSGRCIVTRSRF